MLTTPPEHPFYLAGNVDGSTRPAPVGHEDLSARWVGAGHLKDGDRLRMADGTQGTVVNVRTEQETREMFNLTVDKAHTFYVGTNGWLVHNDTRLVPNLSGLTPAQAEQTLKHFGFQLESETSGGYKTYKFPGDNSKIIIGPDGEIDRLPSTVQAQEAGYNGKKGLRVDGNGNVARPHTFEPEKLSVPCEPE